MTNTAIKFNTVHKDRLFYNCFHYCIGFQLDQVSCLRQLDHDQIDKEILRRQEWRAQSYFGMYSGQTKKNQAQAEDQIPTGTVENLHILTALLLNNQKEFKLVVSRDHAHVYTNDQALILQLDNLSILQRKTHARAKVSRPKNTIQLKTPLHEYRAYFKTTKMTTVQKQQLMEFLNNQALYIRVSPSLSQWLTTGFTRTQDYFFVDYNGSSWNSMLALVAPGLIRKTLNITGAK